MPNKRWILVPTGAHAGGLQATSWKSGAREGGQLRKKSGGILSEGNRLATYQFIDDNHEEFVLCWVFKQLNICPSAYFNYRYRKQAKAEKRVAKAAVCDQISTLYHEYNGNIGHRSMVVFLARSGIRSSKTTVHTYINKELQLLHHWFLCMTGALWPANTADGSPANTMSGHWIKLLWPPVLIRSSWYCTQIREVSTHRSNLQPTAENWVSHETWTVRPVRMTTLPRSGTTTHWKPSLFTSIASTQTKNLILLFQNLLISGTTWSVRMHITVT